MWSKTCREKGASEICSFHKIVSTNMDCDVSGNINHVVVTSMVSRQLDQGHNLSSSMSLFSHSKQSFEKYNWTIVSTFSLTHLAIRLLPRMMMAGLATNQRV